MKKLNKSKGLNLALAMGLVVTNLVTVVPAYGTGAAENIAKSAIVSTRTSQIDKTTATFDKKTPEDVVVEITSENTLNKIKNGSKTLVKDTDYTIADSVVTIKAGYLSKLTVGTKTLKFDFESGSDPSLRIKITDTSAKLSSLKGIFNNTYGKGRDISVTMTLNGNEFLGITDITTGTELVEDTDYTVSGKKVTILKEYLAQQPTGTTKLAFNFDAGTAPVLAVTVKNPDVVAVTIASVSAVNGTVTATLSSVPTVTPVAANFVVKQSIDGAAATTLTPTLKMDGKVATLTVAPVVATTADQSVVYSVSYKGEAAVAAAAVKVDKVIVDTEKPVITLKGDATINLKVGDTFTDPGATVTDNVDKDLVAVVTGTVDTTKAGTYTLNYNVSDKAGNAAVEVTRTVIVAQAALTVSSVNANNLKTVTVAFNKAVDKTTLNGTNVKVYLNNNLVAIDAGATATTVASNKVGYILSDDKAALYLVFGSTLSQSDAVKIVIDGVKATTGEAISGYSNAVTVVDTTVPSVTSVNVENPKTLTVQFSEPANYANPLAQILSNIKVDGIAAIATVTSDFVTNKLTVSFPTALTAGSHAISLTGIPDFAGFKSADQTFTVNVTADITPPVMTTAVATSKTNIRVTFNEAVATAGTFKVNDVAVAVAPVSGTNNQFDLTLATPLDLSAIIEVSVKYIGQVDLVGNTVTTEQELKFSVADDKTAPTVTAQLLTDADKKNDVTFTFSKSMQATLGTITVKDKDSKVIKTLSQPWSYKKDTDNTVLELKAADLGLGQVNPGSYTINLKDFKDNTIRQNALAETNLTVTTVDTLAPSVNPFYTVVPGVTTDTDKVTFYFSEAMDATTLNNLSNYVKDGVPLSSITGASVSGIAADNKSVALVVPSVSVGNATFQLYSLKDLAGNLITSTTVTKSLATSVKVVSATATTTSVVKVVFDAPIAQVDPSSFQLAPTQAGLNPLNFANAVLDATDATNKTVLLTVNGVLPADAKYALEDTTSASLTKDTYGNSLDSATNAALIDKIAPTIKSASVKVDTATINAAVAADGKSGTIDLSSITGNVTSMSLTATESGNGTVTIPGLGKINGTLDSTGGITFTVPNIPGDIGKDGVSLQKLQALATLDYDNNPNTLTVYGDLYDEAKNRTPLTLTITVK